MYTCNAKKTANWKVRKNRIHQVNPEIELAEAREVRMQELMKRHGITAVLHEDPNQSFYGLCAFSGAGEADQWVDTDGKVNREYEDDEYMRGQFNSPGGNPCLWEGDVENTVTGATWAIVTTDERYRGIYEYSRVLYTQIEDSSELETAIMRHHERMELREELMNTYGYHGIYSPVGKTFPSFAQAKKVFERLTGEKFPITDVEKPGKITHEGWETCQYAGVEFFADSVSSALELDGTTITSIDELKDRIRYRLYFDDIRNEFQLRANGTVCLKKVFG